MSGPQPTTVRGNDWRKVEVPPLEEFVPTLPVTVVIPYYEAPEALGLTLAALEGQSYPRELFEVVVVDDGSRIPLRRPTGTSLDVTVLHQEDRGFGAPRARNKGARAASHDILVFLDCDMMPEAGWLAAHARWHHVLSDAFTLGFRAHVEVEGVDAAMVRGREGSLEDLFSGRPAERPEWIEFHMARTNELTSTSDDIFRVVTSGNLGVGKAFFESIGGFDESFTQWGAEDTEFGYRAYARGALLVPVREGFCWHQGAGAALSEEEWRSLDLQRAKIAHLIAHYGFRRASPGRAFTVPQYVVTLETGDVPVDQILGMVERLLGDRIHDLVVRIEDRPEDAGFEWLRRQFGPDPRVRLGSPATALDDFPTAAFHVAVPAGVDVVKNLVYTLRTELGAAVSGTLVLADGSRVSIVRTWALHRARRSARGIDDWGAQVKVKAGKLVLDTDPGRRSRGIRSGLRRLRPKIVRMLRTAWRMRSKVSRLLRALWRIRRPRQAWWFVKWLVGGVRSRLQGVVRSMARLPVDDLPKADYPLGAEIVALGERATAVWGASSRVGQSLGGRHVDLIVADSPEAAHRGWEVGVPVVVLSEVAPLMSVPAFDPRTTNPIGWVREPDPKVGALGRRVLLPPGVEADRGLSIKNRAGLFMTHHVVDVAVLHPDVIDRSATLAAVAATGVVVHLADADPQLESHLGGELYGLMAAHDILSADLGEREMISIAVRRAALRGHSLRSRARQVIAAGSLDPPVLPEVSVLAATGRPHLLPNLLAAVSSQTYPRLELVLILQGDGFGSDLDRLVADLSCPIRVVRVDDSQPLGAALNLGVAASGGTLLTRMYDRSLYAAEHVWDLVLAHEYSQAELVAKGAEFVYLARRDRTVHRFVGRGEAFSTVTTLAGGAMLISRHDLDATGGWRRIPTGVGAALVEDVISVGGRAYRTHGSGHVLISDGSGPRGEAEEAAVLQQAEQVRDGWDPGFAGLETSVLPRSDGGADRGRGWRPPEAGMVGGPRPTAVPGNDWRQIEVPPLAEFVPTLPVTVVVPYYEAPEALELTLSALEGQTYPRHLFEVVVVDDGSKVPLEDPADTTLDMRVVHQEDRGFGLARARNTGARAANHGILVFLDCDMMPEAGWLAAHARWHHLLSDALTLGFRAHVEVDGVDAAMVRGRTGSLEDLFSGRPVEHPEWIEVRMSGTDQLTSTAHALFRMVTGGNFGVSRDFFERVGAFDESFTQWGSEDTEFGYRAHTRGALLVPVREAFCWHQGAGGGLAVEERRSLELQRAKVAHLIAHPKFRSSSPGRTFSVPRYVVTIETGDAPVDKIYSVVERILGDRIYDLVVRVEERPGDAGFEWLRRQLGPDPRVFFRPPGTALDDFPAAPLHVSVPAGIRWVNDLVYRLDDGLGRAVSATLVASDGSRVSVSRAWALRRARRSARSISHFGDLVAVKMEELDPEVEAVLRSRWVTRRVRRVRSKVGRVFEELRRVRSHRQAWWFLKWLAGAVLWRFRGARRYRRTRPPVGTVRTGAGYPLGAQMVTLGPQAEGVFGASVRVGRSLDDGHVDLVVADTPKEARMAEVRKAGVPVVVLSELSPRFSVPAFDPYTTNPIGWVREPENGPGALGPIELLPEEVEAVHRVARNDREALRLVHHVEDVASFHPDVTTRAATLAALVGMGVVVHLADTDPQLEACLGSELYGLMAAADILEAGIGERELISINMRRAALRDHALRSRARQIIGAGSLDAPVLPEVSILAPTKRPHLVPGLLATVSSQTYPSLELVLALHGDGFDDDVEAGVKNLPCPARVLRVGADQPLGVVLNRAVSASGGTLVTKMDDDDLYAPEHVWDLVLAHEYSKAELVAKGAEFVYLTRSDLTLHRFCGRGEASSRVISVAGGTMLISRHDLDFVGGWRRVPGAVDAALLDDVRRVEGRIYRTHGFGYVLVRHGSGHTWESDDAYFLQHAERVRQGWAPEFAGLDPSAVPPTVAARPSPVDV